MTGRLKLAVALLLLLPIAAAAENATGTGWTKVTMPANDGFVLSFEVPPGWKHSYFGEFSKYGVYESNGERPQMLLMSFYQPGHEQPIFLHMAAYSSTISLEDFAKTTRVSTRNRDTLQAGFDQSFGRRSYSRTDTDEGGWGGPSRRESVTMFHDRVGILARFQSYSGKFSELVEPFDRIIKSIAVTAVADLDADQVWQLYVSPRVTFTPGKWNLEANFSLALPPGWQAEVVEVLEAGSGGAKAGRIVVDFFPPGSSDKSSFTVHLDGKPYKVRLRAAALLATRDPIVASMATDAKVAETERDVAMPEDQFWNGWYISQDGFCLSRSHTRRFHKTGHTAVKTYAGKDALSGKDVKLRIHTAGGVTLACNLIFRAPPDDFDRLAPQVDEMVRSVKVEYEGMIFFK